MINNVNIKHPNNQIGIADILVIANIILTFPPFLNHDII